MFDDGDACFIQQVVVENGPGNFRNVFQLIGRVGEDDVELASLEFLAGGENIVFEDSDVLETDFSGSPFYEAVMVVIQFYGGYLFRSAGGEFVADASRAGEQIQHRGIFDIDVVVQYVEDIFLGEISRGSRREIFVGENLPSPVGAADYSHLCRLNR